MYSAPRGQVCTLNLQFKYQPTMAFAPIHEVMEGRNERIKKFYAQVWFEKSEDGESVITVDDPEFEFTHSNELIRKEDIRQFCLVVGNQSDMYVEHRDGVIYAPMDFAGRACWPMTCKSILPKIVDGDVLNLVHMSNGFRMVDGAEPLKAGDVVESRARIVEVTNEETGKRSRIRGHVYRDGKPVVEVTTSFFYRGAFTDFANTFRNVDEQPTRVTLETTLDVAVLRSKEWFVPLEDTGHELQPGAILEFRLASEYRFKSRTMYSRIRTHGRIMMQVSTKEYVHIADVSYECGESVGNPVVEYLRRHGQPISDSFYFENGGYSVMPHGSEFSSIVHSPGTNEPYSNISKDHNPIHTNEYFADYAELPGTITHGMWTSASTRKFVETFAADNHPERVKAYEVEFVGMVLPNDQLETKLSHVGMKEGRKLIKVETFNQHGSKVLEGMAEVEQPITGYTFTGQGSQEPVSQSYFEEVHELTGSARVGKALKSWDDSKLNDPAEVQRLSHVLLIELLAYQFASPVRWIETQDKLFKDYGIERFIEFGPSPTLCGMAQRTLKFKYEAYDDAIAHRRSTLCYSKHEKELYYAYDPEPEAEAEAPAAASETPAAAAPAAPAPAPAAAAAAAAPAPAAGGAGAPIDDVPVKAVDIIHTIVCQKLKKSLDEVPMSKSIKELVGGKSTLQNEILGDLQKEFGNDREQNRMVTQQLEVLARYLGLDLRKGDREFEAARVENGLLQAEVDLWMEEHGEFYANGIRPSFDARKARTFDSYWNWARQDALILYYEILFGRLTEVDREITSQCIRLMNRANPALMRYMAYNIANTDESRGETYKLAREYAQMLYENCELALNHSPVYKDVDFPTGPRTEVTATGDIKYSEVHRPDERKLLDYVRKMQAGGELTRFSGRQRVEQNLAKIYRIIKQQNSLKKDSKQAIQGLYTDVLRALRMSPRIMEESGVRRVFSRSRLSGSSEPAEVAKETIPFLHLKRKLPTGEWEFNSRLTGMYLEVLTEMCTNGQTFENKNVLMTGCGKDSIGAEVLKGLLSGGARVVVTTSRYNREAMMYYQGIYQQYGARGSTLIVVPFNQASLQDVKKLVEFIYDDSPRSENLGWDLDYVIPCAAIPEQGREITDIDSRSELAHRIMLTNLLRLLGEIKTRKAARGYETRPAQVILPLSPNHGLFGSDGLYSESKIALETLFNRWYSESWSAYLTITGTVIGWTRGTGLMNANNIVAEGIEKLGVRTFSTQEMAFNILGLMHPTINALSQAEPVWADLNGGFQFIPDLKEATARLRASIRESSEVKKAVAADSALDFKAVAGPTGERMHQSRVIKPRANHKFPFPQISSYEKLEHLRHLQGMVDLDKVVVVTGYGEVGPWGNAETRWEMEAFGEFSLEGCIELAWVMGYIKHFNGRLKNKQLYSGWVDAKTEEPVEDKDIKARYEKQILEHTGIRLIEPELLDGYDPNKKPLMRELQIEHDMEPFEASSEEAAAFKLRNGDKVDVWENSDGSWSVRFLKGAMLMIPKALRFDRLVAAQIPTGWDPVRYGIPKDVADQVDPITCYVLVATVEALVRSGITDPYEFYKYVHVSEVGNSTGSGVGGMNSNKLMYKERYFDKDIQNDILQETFINTMAAWVNLLMMSSSGPIKPTVGACATSVLSVDVAIDTIQNGKAKIMLCGGFDYFQEDGSYEFAQMKATSNALDEFARGRTPAEMSRPCTTTRSGFMEGEGAGIMTVMSATTALEIGVPVYGVLAMCGTAMDKEGRSVPAPGQGILTSAREMPGSVPSPLLDIKYRRRQLESRRAAIKEWAQREQEYVQQEVEALKASPAGLPCGEEVFVRERMAFIAKEARRQEAEALSLWGNNFWQQDPRIAPLRGALAVWGLTVDDIGVASFHGTSTKANDKNESHVIEQQFKHLGRTPGNACPAICQKWLTGHPKGAAAAWMLNGVMQCLRTGIIPGNRNADNIAAELEQFEYIMYPSRSIQTDGIKAGLLKSFGFGQVGGEVLVLHPDFLMATLPQEQLEQYAAKVKGRESMSYRYWHNTLAGVHPFVQIKSEAPYTADQESQVYLNPLARAEYDTAARKYVFKRTNQTEA
ncbi:fatty acid synthase alpha subunit Lsd1 [Coemansia sp. RSA 989]|nr:fatty acid synthase alpha subunit Lsd1 [Coemansia sp. RSA 989]